MSVVINGSSGIQNPLGSASAPAESNTTNANTGAYFPTGTTYGIATNGSNAMYIDASQNVGIGTSSPSTKLSISTAATTDAVRWTDGVNSTGLLSTTTGASTMWSTAALAFGTGAASFTERMRIDSSGNLLVGTTSSSASNSNSTIMFPSAMFIQHASGTASGSTYAAFNYNAAGIGSITQNGTTGVLYNITSDYRLKDNPTKITNGVETIQKLNPVNFTWKTDNSADSGFIAHEFQSVIPRSVTGEKDAVDADGKPVYQGMDNSGAIPYLVAAIQELKTTVDAQAAEITALKAKVGV